MALGFAVVLLCAVSVGYSLWVFKAPGPLKSDSVVLIAPGSSSFDIAKTLERAGALSHETALLFPHLARLKGAASSLKAGEYKVAAQSSAAEVMHILQSGKTVQRQITIAEGLTSVEVTALVNNASFMTGQIIDIPAEGSLLPESYAYVRGGNRKDMIQRMQKQMQATVDTLWQARVEGLPIKTKEDAVILASIVEKETGIKGERAKVAGVFINRLRIGMPLQSDPTVIYAMTRGKKKLGRKLYTKDLKRADPYNTYHINGLPPTPIANPGRASLEAVLNPESHKYLYFVADGTGGHAFAKTLDGHNKNVAHWRKISKKVK